MIILTSANRSDGGARREKENKYPIAYQLLTTFRVDWVYSGDDCETREECVDVTETNTSSGSDRNLIISNNCQNCHGGSQWTSARVRQTAPPDASLLGAGQLLTELRPGNTFDATAFNEIGATAAPPLGAGGFNPPTLLSLHAFP